MTPAAITQSVAWWCFVPGHFTPEAFVRAVAEAGYTAIDLAPEAHWPLVKAHGLKLSAIAGHNSITLGLNQRDQHARIEAELRAALARAEAWEIPNLICFAGSRAGTDEAAAAAITAEGLRRVAPAAEAAGVTLVLELLNSKVDHPGYQADHTAWGVAVCQQVDSPRVRLLYDIYHMQIMEGDLIRTVREAHPWITHYHTAGNPGRHEPDAAQEIAYPAVWRAIAATGYRGYIAHEFIPRGEALAALRQTFVDCAACL